MSEQEGGRELVKQLREMKRQHGPESVLKLLEEDEQELPPHDCPLHDRMFSSENSTVVALAAAALSPPPPPLLLR